MNYKNLLESHLIHGTTKEDILKRQGYEGILKNVVIAPWWGHEIFEHLNLKIEKINDKLYNFYGDNVEFSFVELKLIGAPVIFDQVLALGVTECKNLLFIGSAGSLDKNIKIGDIVIPQYSICGDGASRYLNVNLEDEFGKKEYPTTEYTNKLLNIVKSFNDVNCHYSVNYSVDTIFAQFVHIDEIIKQGAKTIEMETAALFKCNSILNFNITALFCISDNVVLNKSLYSGRNGREKEYKNKVKYEIIPKVIIKLFKEEKGN